MRRESGFSLISAVMSMAIVSASFAALNSAGILSANISKSNSDHLSFSILISSLRLVMGHANLCGKTGLIDTEISDVSNPSSSQLSVYYPETTGPSSNLVAQQGFETHGWHIDSFSFGKLTEVGMSGPNRVFLGRVDVQATKLHSSMGSPSKSESFFLTIHLTPLNKISKCYGDVNTSVDLASCSWRYPVDEVPQRPAPEPFYPWDASKPNHAMRPNWAQATCNPGSVLMGHKVKFSRNTDEDSELEITSTSVKARRATHGSWAYVNAYCCPF